jgi:histone acetyltransferase MYST1
LNVSAPQVNISCCLLLKSCSEHAYVLDRRGDEAYVHYLNTDKRMDEWIPEGNLRPASTESNLPNGTSAETTTRRTAGTKRKRGHQSVSPSPEDDTEDGHSAGPVQEEATITISEEDYDFEQHKRITAQRNFDKVHFGEWQIKTWYEWFYLVLCIGLTGWFRYFSPYPLTETEMDDSTVSSSLPSPGSQTPSSGAAAARTRALAAPGGSRIPGVPRTTPRSHVRTSDLLAGGLGRQYIGPGGERATLWVCDMCFKYMPDGLTWEMHKVWVVLF